MFNTPHGKTNSLPSTLLKTLPYQTIQRTYITGVNIETCRNDVFSIEKFQKQRTTSIMSDITNIKLPRNLSRIE